MKSGLRRRFRYVLRGYLGYFLRHQQAGLRQARTHNAQQAHRARGLQRRGKIIEFGK